MRSEEEWVPAPGGSFSAAAELLKNNIKMIFVTGLSDAITPFQVTESNVIHLKNDAELD